MAPHTSKLLVLFLLVCAAEQCWPRNAAQCRRPGDIVCAQDCAEIALCVTDAAGEVVPLPVETCSEERFCYAPVQACIEVNACDPANRPPFECTKATSFPDPYECTRYHICFQLDDLSFAGDEIECDDGFAFDPLRKVCGLRINETIGYPRACNESPVPACLSPGQSGSLFENPSMYYVCKVGAFLYPVLYECRVGEVYDDALQSCQKEAVNSDLVGGYVVDEDGASLNYEELFGGAE